MQTRPIEADTASEPRTDLDATVAEQLIGAPKGRTRLPARRLRFWIVKRKSVVRAARAAATNSSMRGSKASGGLSSLSIGYSANRLTRSRDQASRS